MMQDAEAWNHPTQSGEWLPPRSALKLLNDHLGVDYSAYTTVFHQR